DPELRGRWGAARLAAEAGVPVVPIGLWGTEAVWPRSDRFPRILNVTHPPTVRARVGPPVEGLEGTSPEADTGRLMGATPRPPPPGAPPAPGPHAGGTGPHVPAGPQGRRHDRGRPPPGRGLTESPFWPQDRGP